MVDRATWAGVRSSRHGEEDASEARSRLPIFTADRTNDPPDTADSLGFRLSGCNPATDVDCCDPADPDCFGGLYLKVPGTSFAVAYVTGVASLVISKRPELSAREVETVLRNTADDLGAPGYDEKFGHGLVNGEKALEYLESYIFADGFESGDALAWSSSVNLVVFSELEGKTSDAESED